MALVKLVIQGATPVSLKVKDASLQDIVAQLKHALPPGATIEVRDPGPARFTLDLPSTAPGDILHAIANVVGCKLYVFHDHLLITSEKKLTPDERPQAKEWAKNTLGGGFAWSAFFEGELALGKVLVPVIEKMVAARVGPVTPETTEGAPNAKAASTIQLRVGEFDPQIQQLLQQLVDWRDDQARIRLSRSAVLRLTPDTPVMLTVAPRFVRVVFKANATTTAEPASVEPATTDLGNAVPATTTSAAAVSATPAPALERLYDWRLLRR